MSASSGDPARPAAAFLCGMLAAGSVAVVGVEMLSGLGQVRQVPAVLLVLTCAAAFVLVIRRPRNPTPRWLQRPSHPGLLAPIVVIAAITLVIALRAAPTTWDSMTYHLARVAQWYDHQTVQHYPTAIDRQLWQPPFAEFFVLIGYTASGGHDFLANLPQWLGGAGAVVATMEIARVLGAPSTARYFVGIVTASAPAVILQATSTHTDLLAGCWIAIGVWLVLKDLLATESNMPRALAIGAAFGLALGTKGTALPIGVPWLLVFLLTSVRKGTGWARLAPIGTVTLVILLLNGPHWLRNLAVFDTPLGPSSIQRMLLPDSYDPRTVLSNLVALGSLQIGTPWGAVNDGFARAFTIMNQVLGLDPDVLYPYFGGFRIIAWMTHEDTAGNAVHAFLGGAAIVAMVAGWRRISRPERIAAAAFLLGVLLFGATVRWQPFTARLQIPFLVLLGPCLLIPLIRVHPRLAGIGVFSACLLALPSLVLNASRPLLPPAPFALSWVAPRSILVEPRERQYFANRPQLYRSYTDAVAQLDSLGCTRAALAAGYDSWEYPLWALSGGRMRFAHRAAGHAGDCAVVALDPPAAWRPSTATSGTRPLLRAQGISVWRTAPAP